MTAEIKNADVGVKIDILTSALSERYESMHAIRKRVQETGVWSLGLTLGAGGWVISSPVHLSCAQKAIYSAAVLLSFVLIRFFYLEDFCKGFKSQQRVAARIEASLGLYDVGVFDEVDRPIYPSDWKSAGREDGDGRFFFTTYLLIYLATGFLLIAIVGKGLVF